MDTQAIDIITSSSIAIQLIDSGCDMWSDVQPHKALADLRNEYLCVYIISITNKYSIYRKRSERICICNSWTTH